MTLTASAQPGWRFAGWRGDQRSPLNPYSFAIQKATTLTATFEPLELTLGVVGNGTVWRDPPGPYMVGQRITVTAQPAAGWKFAGWNGDQNGLSNPHSFAMQSATVLTATFVPLDIALTVVGQGSVERNPPSPYAAGQTITLTAQAANGWKFIGWSGDLAGSQNPYSLILTQSLAVTVTLPTNAPNV